jgi:uncharacterized protein YukE
MANVAGDPAELRRFAKDLSRFNQELEQLMMSLRAKTAALGKSWRDQEHAKFAEEFDQTVKVLGRFLESSRQHATVLQRKAGHLEEYLNQR